MTSGGRTKRIKSRTIWPLHLSHAPHSALTSFDQFRQSCCPITSKYLKEQDIVLCAEEIRNFLKGWVKPCQFTAISLWESVGYIQFVVSLILNSLLLPITSKRVRRKLKYNRMKNNKIAETCTTFTHASQEAVCSLTRWRPRAFSLFWLWDLEHILPAY